jgi:hypothetical protein
VNDFVAVARANHGDVVDALRGMREKIGNVDAILAVFGELARGAE